MSGRWALAAAITAALFTAAPAVAQTDGKTVTATGTGQVRVQPTDRHSNSSIAAAVDAARKAAITGAFSQAHEYALEYANDAGLTLGSVLSVSDAQSFGPYGGGGSFFGPFGPNKYCGTLRQAVGKAAPGKRRQTKKVHRCLVPPFAFTTLSVTYSAS